MAPSDARDAPIDVLGDDDLDAALALSAEAGWNQVAADWRLMLRLGSGFAIRDGGRARRDGHRTPLPARVRLGEHGARAHAVPAAAASRRGWSSGRRPRSPTPGWSPVLDATPAGAGVYGPMGFRPVGNLMRWRGHGRRRGRPPRGAGLADASISTSTATRSAPTAAPSSPTSPRAPRPSPARGGGDGYLLSRAGRTGTQIGPLVARDATTAVALLAARPRRRRRHGRRRRAGAGDGRRRAPRRPRLRAGAAVRPHGARPRRDRRHARARPRHRRAGARLMRWQDLPADALAAFRAGTVIPAHPLALDAERRLDERRQRALTRYYLDAGAGGLAVGVHTTQFAIRDVGLYRPVLELAAETARGVDDARRCSSSPASPGAPSRPSPRPARARPRLPRGPRQPRGVPRRRRGDDARPLPRPRRRAARDRLLPAARGRRRRALARVLGALRARSRTSSGSRSRRSTATARSTSCTAWPRPARRSGSRSTPATTTTSCST